MSLSLLHAETAPRKALVIGNSNYQFLQPIPAAQAGAAAIARVLHDLNFEVVEGHDLSLKKLRELIETQFIPGLQAGDDCLIYYSGYGLQSQRSNYFVSVDFNPQVQEEVYSVAYSMDRLRNLLNTKKLAQEFFFLEASWDSPRLAAWTGAPGLAPEAGSAADTVLLFDTGSGQSVPLPAGGMGLFTSALVSALRPRPGLNLTEVIQSVETEVTKASNDRQHPYVVGARLFEFIPVPVEPPAPPRPQPPAWPKQGSVVMNKDRQEYVYIPSGTFLMGCVPAAQRQCEPNEKPQHKVEISKPFWLGETELEVEAYRRFVKQERHNTMPKAPMWNKGWQVPGFPIVYVTWDDAQAYCAWAGGRLPTEAEWEYAARAGTDNQVFPFKDNKETREKANFSGRAGNDQYDEAAPVKQFDPNGFGLYDMSGNVWEWAADFYDPDYYQASPAVDPPGPRTGKSHVARGGSYDSAAEKHLRLSYRMHFERSWNHLGFRCLLPDTPETRAQFKLTPH